MIKDNYEERIEIVEIAQILLDPQWMIYIVGYVKTGGEAQKTPNNPEY